MSQFATRSQWAIFRSLAVSPVWVLLATWGAVDLVWCAATGFRIVGIRQVIIIALFLISVSLICHAIHRFNMLRDLSNLFALGVLTGIVTTFAVCLSVLNAAPLVDANLNTMDRVLGFDWMAWYRTVAPIRPILAFVYQSLTWQIVASLCWFAATNRAERGREFMAITLLSLIPGIWALHTMPALGPFVDFGMVDHAPYLPMLLALRSGALVRDVHQDAGFVCLPSFHTIWALALIYVHRDSRWTLPIVTSINLIMLISVLSEGGHYLVDLIAGVAVVIVVIIGIGWWMRGLLRAPSGSALGSQSA